jgi:arylsulfatase A-like enzyme
VSFHAPHPPLQAPDARIRRQAPGPRKRQVLGAMVEAMDDAIAALLDELVRSGRGQSTLVVFLADNGAGGEGRTGGLRGGKGTCYEGGLRVPAVMRWSGQLPAGRTSGQRISAEDLLPTLLDALDLPIDGEDDLDGSSLWPEILEGRERVREPLFVAADSQQERSRALLDGAWKLVQRYDEARGSWRSELFDIEEDPGEERDLAAREPAVTAALEARLERWFVQELGAPARRPAEPPADWSPPPDWAEAALP